MNQTTKELFLRVADGNEANKILMLYLLEIRNRKYCDQILKWLIENRLTGHNLISWINQHSLQKPTHFISRLVYLINSKTPANYFNQ